jgi:hypothetical protein
MIDIDKIDINKILEVMARDNYKCRYCDYDAAASLDAWRHGRMCIDHFFPKSKGGTNDDSNLFTCCAACNTAKAANVFTDLDQARRFIEFYKREYTRPWFETNVVGRKRVLGRGPWFESGDVMRARFQAEETAGGHNSPPTPIRQ